jgi:hypothetical protein
MSPDWANLLRNLLVHANTWGEMSTFLVAMTMMMMKTSQLLSGLDDHPCHPQILKVFSSDLQSIKGGIIQTLKNKDQAPYNILLVGETGTGKSSLLEFIANVLIGKDIDSYDFAILDYTNEQGGSSCQSQTNSARVYELKSKNGIMVSVSGGP